MKVKLKRTPSRERLEELFYYDRHTGNLIRRKSQGNQKAGSIAGLVHTNDYTRVSVDGTHYFAHRLIYKMVMGCEPLNFLDHADGNRQNNRWSNLREATHSQNNRHRKTIGEVPLKGVYYTRGKFRAQIRIDGVKTYIGSFDTPEEAHDAYCEKAKELGLEDWICQR